MMRLMKWLLGNWCGRLYLVAQIICVAISTYLCVQFINENATSEMSEQYAIWSFYGVPKSDGTILQGAEGERLKRDIIQMRRQHSEERQEFILRYALYNLGVPALWLIGLFIAKGLPTRKTDRPQDRLHNAPSIICSVTAPTNDDDHKT